LGFVAAQMMPNPVNGVNLHDPRMDPLWAEAERLNVPICFHPAPNNYSDTHFVNRFLTAPSTTIAGGLNNPVELMAAVASMTAGGGHAGVPLPPGTFHAGHRRRPPRAPRRAAAERERGHDRRP